MTSNFADLMESRAREYYLKAFANQAPLLIEMLGKVKPKPLSARQRKKLEREGKLQEFAQMLHTLALNLGASCDCEDC